MDSVSIVHDVVVDDADDDCSDNNDDTMIEMIMIHRHSQTFEGPWTKDSDGSPKQMVPFCFGGRRVLSGHMDIVHPVHPLAKPL